SHTLRQYLQELEQQNPVEEAVHEQDQVSTTDPDSTYATKGGTPARLGYYDNYLVNNASLYASPILWAKSDIDAAACTRCQSSAARVGLGEIPWIGSGNANPSDAQAARAHVGQSHPFRRTGCANRDGTTPRQHYCVSRGVRFKLVLDLVFRRA